MSIAGLTIGAVVVIFFYFLCLWGFRLVLVVILLKLVEKLKNKGKEALQEFQENVSRGTTRGENDGL